MPTLTTPPSGATAPQKPPAAGHAQLTPRLRLQDYVLKLHTLSLEALSAQGPPAVLVAMLDEHILFREDRNSSTASFGQAVLAHDVEVIELRPKSPHTSPLHITLGRGERADVTLPHRGLSRTHLRFTGQGGAHGWTITDLGSKNGSYVEGQRLQPHTVVPIRDRACISLCNIYHFRFFRADSFYQSIVRLAAGQRQPRAAEATTSVQP
ncbi:MAG: FHA domain-containing protein [Polyangiales bacterium]